MHDYSMIQRLLDDADERDTLRLAICPDGSITETPELLEYAKDLQDAYSKLSAIEDVSRERESLRKELTYQGESHQQTATLYQQQIDALRRRVAVLEGACKMTVAQWDDVCVPGAACEGCPEPDYVAACRVALRAGAGGGA